MTRKFTKPDYVATPNTLISLGEAIPANHLARFVVDIVAQLDLSEIYKRYAIRGGEAIAPEALLALVFYGYSTGKFSSRKIEKATYEDLGFRFVAGGLHPDHDTIANFRKTFLPELQGLFVQILLLAQLSGVLKVGNLSLDGSKIHADASKSKAVSYGRLKELETTLREEVAHLFELGERADQGDVELPEGLVIGDEIAFRKERLESLAKAKAVLDALARNVSKPKKRNMMRN
jgi:transposase